MKKPDRDPGRGQLHRRGARVWRDEANPTGPTHAHDEPAPEDEVHDDSPAGGGPEQIPDEAPADESTANAGPGSGGATQSSGRAKHHEGLHGGPSRKP